MVNIEEGTQYNGQNRRKAHNTMINIEERHTIQRSKQKKGTQYNGQNRRKAHNTMVKQKKDTQYNGQNRGKAHNTTVKIEERHTIQR